MSNVNDVGKIATALSFLASAIKSGEHWTAECEQMKNEAFSALERLAQKPKVRTVSTNEFGD